MIVTSEQVSCGHPDKICDQIADAIVTECLKNDKNSRVAVECLIKNYDIVIAGEITSTFTPHYENIARDVLKRIGLEDTEKYKVKVLVSKQSPDIAQGVDTGGAGDQGMMFGYATNETPELLPVPFVLATKALTLLRDFDRDMFLPDAKAQVSYDYKNNRITTFLISTQHKESASVDDIRPVVESIMENTALEYGYNTNFRKLVNPTGRFVIGSSFADTGVTGRKLAADTYGGIGRIGGGALSSKDPSKVDRSGAYMARKIAKDMVKTGIADKCEVQLAYAIGVPEPVSVAVNCFGTEKISVSNMSKYIRNSYDLTPRGIIEELDLLNVDYNLVSAYGHFGKAGLPWEE